MADIEQVRELADALRAAERNLEIARRRHEIASVNLAHVICPHRVGDLIEITGASYRGQTGLVKSVRMVPYMQRYEWQAEVVVLKSNGDESAHRTQVREHG